MFGNLYEILRRDRDMNCTRRPSVLYNPKNLDHFGRAYRGIALVSVPRSHGTMSARTPRNPLAPPLAAAAATLTCELNIPPIDIKSAKALVALYYQLLAGVPTQMGLEKRTLRFYY